MQNWTDDRVKQAISVLERSRSVAHAERKLGVTAAAMRAGFQRARERGFKCGTPAEHVGGLNASVRRSELSLGAIERVIICPDVHVPYHDALAWDTFLAACASWKPDTFVNLGDYLDCYSISNFTKSPARKHNFASEVRCGVEEADRIEALGIPRVVFLGGNHEDRLDRHIADNAPELHGLTSIPELLEFERRPGWEYVSYGEPFKLGHLHLCHDYGAAGSRAVSQALSATGHCVGFGHTHRAGIEYSGTTDGTRHVGATFGYLADPNALAFSYMRRWKARKDWTHGFGTACIDRATGNAWVNFHPIIDGRVILDGQIISGR